MIVYVYGLVPVWLTSGSGSKAESRSKVSQGQGQCRISRSRPFVSEGLVPSGQLAHKEGPPTFACKSMKPIGRIGIIYLFCYFRPAHENHYMGATPANPMRNCEVANLR